MKQGFRPRNGRIGLAAATALLAAGALLGGATAARANDLDVYDQGEHLRFPEGPIHQDGVWLVPLRPVAERFGYAIVEAGPKEVRLAGGAIGSVTLYPGQRGALLNGAVKRTYQAPPQYIHGTLFVPLDAVGELTDIGYSVLAGPPDNPSAIRLRPGGTDAAALPDEQYWTAANAGYGKTVYVNGKGETVLTTTNAGADSFGYADLTPYYKNGFGQGYMDRSGKLAVPASHYRLGAFSEGMAVYKDLYPVSEGTYQVKYGYVNRDGVNLYVSGYVPAPLLFSGAYPFSDGLAKVVQDGKTFYIDHTGKTVIPPIPGSLHTRPFANGLAAVEMRVKVGGQPTARIGFIDTKGRFAIPPTLTWADDFADNGLAAAVLNGKSGYIDKTGRWVIPARFAGADKFSGGYAVVQTATPAGAVFELIDAAGKKVKLPPHKSLGRASQGLIAFKSADGLWGYADMDGAVAVAPRFVRAGDFQGGLASVLLPEDGGKFRDAYIDKTGSVVWQSAFAG
ncbi:WG repeat-containing protein [Paenibacillus sp. MWE-103]|uniref:WG repeat-containing protein n=1 Tax=Paenibacillus artemisiicola TaxID=1172618 RepID=A0ABS3W8C3_9BACL|nr:WG repeat-containing protein [Paenibacillus artemisiicola]MBO7744570.1 WG repeat-containing protein [Paenibacillus artemisiicola]